MVRLQCPRHRLHLLDHAARARHLRYQQELRTVSHGVYRHLKVRNLHLKRRKRPVFYTPGSPHPHDMPFLLDEFFDGGKDWPPRY